MARWGWVDIIRGFRYGDGSRIYLFIWGGGSSLLKHETHANTGGDFVVFAHINLMMESL